MTTRVEVNAMLSANSKGQWFRFDTLAKTIVHGAIGICNPFSTWERNPQWIHQVFYFLFRLRYSTNRARCSSQQNNSIQQTHLVNFFSIVGSSFIERSLAIQFHLLIPTFWSSSCNLIYHPGLGRTQRQFSMISKENNPMWDSFAFNGKTIPESSGEESCL